MAKTVTRKFKNVATGLVEIVTDEKTIELMEASDRYEAVTDKKDEAKSDAK